jgi:hypothetical protein
MNSETLIAKIDLLLQFQGFYAKEFVELGALALAAKIDRKLQTAKVPFPTFKTAHDELQIY